MVSPPEVAIGPESYGQPGREASGSRQGERRWFPSPAIMREAELSSVAQGESLAVLLVERLPAA